VFLLVDLFDNVGTLGRSDQESGLTAPDGSIPRLNRILIVDSLAMTVGAVAGTSPVTSYIESAAGVASGRTHRTHQRRGRRIVPVHAVLRPVGAGNPGGSDRTRVDPGRGHDDGALAEVDWIEPAEAIPAFLTVIMIPLTYSIANGLAFGIISHAILKLLRGRATLRDWLVYVLSALFIARFIYLA